MKKTKINLRYYLKRKERKMVVKVVGFGILSALTAFVLSECGFKGKRAYTALGVCLLLIYFLDSFGTVVSEISSLNISNDTFEALKSALKILGVAYAFSFGMAVSEELSEKGIAQALMLVGQVEILLISMPYIKDIFNLASELIGSV